MKSNAWVQLNPNVVTERQIHFSMKFTNFAAECTSSALQPVEYLHRKSLRPSFYLSAEKYYSCIISKTFVPSEGLTG